MILLTGGGTGGHLSVAKAVREALNERGVRPLFIGSTGGQDTAWFKNDPGFAHTLFLPSRGVMNRGILGRIGGALRMLALAVTCVRFFRKHGVTAVFSVGGYSAAPAALAAVLTGRKLFIHEQNARPGTLNRLLRPFARNFFSSFDAASPCTDYPVRPLFFETARTRTKLNTLLFLGGSQGARSINRLALDLAPKLREHPVAILHQTGKADLPWVQERYRELGVDAVCFDFRSDLPDLIARADFAVARSGAGTLFELAANRLPALFVPYPHAAGDHQYANARFLADRGAAEVIREEELNAERVWEIVQKGPAPFAAKLEGLLAPGGAECIAEVLLRSES